MAASITTRPDYRSLTGTQPVGHTQIVTASEYAGTITLVTRVNAGYWCVIVRSARNAFRQPTARNITPERIGMATKVWHNGDQYVADYWLSSDSPNPVEAGTAADLRAAIAIAVDSCARRGHEIGLW